MNDKELKRVVVWKELWKAQEYERNPKDYCNQYYKEKIKQLKKLAK